MRSSTVLLLGLLSAGGCASVPAATTPMMTVADPANSGRGSLVVFLPGQGDRATDFVDHGMMAPLAGVDLLAADAHYGYYRSLSVVDRLEQDVIAPARASGYRRIILVGISMGGLGALLYSEAHPDTIDGLILIAPYLDDGPLAEEIANAGGLLAWSGEASAGEPYQREVWRSLQRRVNDGEMIYLMYGSDDRFAPSLALLAAALPADAVLIGGGGHNWSTWMDLWRSFVAEGVLDRRF
jgi:pimeloyl-ACP methyl ester carboxylesterase